MAMFDWVPFLQGKYFTYYQYFAFVGCMFSLLQSFMSFFLYLILCRISPTTRKTKQKAVNQITGNKLIDRLKHVCFNGGFIFLSLVPLILSAFDIIYLVAGMLGMMAVYTFQAYMNTGHVNWKKLENHENNDNSTQMSISKRSVSKNEKNSLKFKRNIKRAILASIILPLLAYKTCVCFYNEEIGYYNFSLGFGINTYISRFFQLEKACPVGPPCQIYATIPQNPEQAFFLNLHTHEDVDNVTVFYQELSTQSPDKWLHVIANSYNYPILQWQARRKVHSALIYDLKPNTKYLVKVHYDNQFWTNAIYKTLPSDPSTPIRMINAGDSGYTKPAIKLSKIASTLKPDIFFMGGDVAYDDNMPACSFTWDSFLKMYGKLTTTLGYLMPIVLAVGNHDVGMNQLSFTNVTVGQNGPAFFLYFPQHYDQNLDGHIVKQVPPPHRRRSILNFTFSNVHYMCLDTGYLHGFDGHQKKMMIDSFQANRDKIKFVSYHVPVYTACKSLDNNPERFLYALFHWVPNFDKYKVMTSFQNHVHAFKRTKPLKGSSPTQNGTVYLGDGSYGAIPREMCQPDITLDIFQKFDHKSNFWISQIGADKVKHIAYASDGQIIDQFEQDVSAYVLPRTPLPDQSNEENIFKLKGDNKHASQL